MAGQILIFRPNFPLLTFPGTIIGLEIGNTGNPNALSNNCAVSITTPTPR